VTRRLVTYARRLRTHRAKVKAYKLHDTMVRMEERFEIQCLVSTGYGRQNCSLPSIILKHGPVLNLGHKLLRQSHYIFLEKVLYAH
jgi:hypothetical protein